MYNVFWKPIAEQELAAIWLKSTDRLSITVAATQADTLLALIPLEIGESRTSTVHRIAFCLPLGVEYEVVEDDKIVIVQGVFAVG